MKYVDLPLIQLFIPNITPELQIGIIQLSTMSTWRTHWYLAFIVLFKTPPLPIFLICAGHFLLDSPDGLSTHLHIAVFSATLTCTSLLPSLILLSSHIQVRILDPALSAPMAFCVCNEQVVDVSALLEYNLFDDKDHVLFTSVAPVPIWGSAAW